jgi:membrane protease YdiL (CAAX protease family)
MVRLSIVPDVLPEARWRGESMMRLILSVFICVYAGSVVSVMVSRWSRAGWSNFGPVVLVGVAALACLGIALWLARRPWNLEQLMRQLGFVVGFFYAGIVLGMIAHKVAGVGKPTAINMVIGGLSFQGAVLVLGRLFLREHGEGWATAFGLEERPTRAVFVGLALGCAFLPLGWLLQQVSFWVSFWAMNNLGALGIKPIEQETVQALRTTASWADKGALALVTIVLAPLAEEVLFRGIVYSWIRQVGFPRLALWGTAVLFGLVHLNFVIFLPLMALSVVLTLLYVRTGNLLAPIAAHAVFNLLNFLLLQLVSSPAS